MIFRKQIVLCGCCFQVVFLICLQFETAVFGLKTCFRPICAGFVVLCLCDILRFLYYYRCMRPFCAIHFAVKPLRIIWKVSYKSLPDLDVKFFSLMDMKRNHTMFGECGNACAPTTYAALSVIFTTAATTTPVGV